MNIFFYENKYFFAIRKPHHIPSTFGDKESFLDILINSTKPQIQKIIWILYWTFWLKNELWLVNRLDNKTSWFLFFAKNQLIFDKYKQLQQNLQTNKIYFAQVEWDFKFNEITINFPIMHHKHVSEKMIVIKNENDQKKWRWKQHHCQTIIKKINYNQEYNTSNLHIQIEKWIRHQIRVHLQSIWYPIIWDDLYWKFDKENDLHLWSLGLILPTNSSDWNIFQ